MAERVLAVLVVLWPAILWLLATVIYLASLIVGIETTDTFSGLAFYLVYVVLWMPIGLVLLGLLRFLLKSK